MDVQIIVDSMLKVVSTGYEQLKRSAQLVSDTADNNSKENKIQVIRFSNVVKITEEFNTLKFCLLKLSSNGAVDVLLSVSQSLAITKCVDFLVFTGLIPCLIPSVLDSFDNIQKKLIPSSVVISPIENYEELKYLVDTFFDLVEVPALHRVIMGKHTNVLLAGLCQLCLLPIAKPGTQIALKSSINESKYEELMNEQKMFKTILVQLILKERNPLVIRELLFVLGNKNCHKHLKTGLGELVSELMLQPNGIKTFLKVACDLIGEKSQDFCQQGLQEWSNLIHSFYAKSKTKYIQYIKPQVWDLLRSNQKSYQIQFRSVAVHCIYLISVDNYNDFLTYYINPIHDSTKKCKLIKEKTVSVSQCIEDLHTLFYSFKKEFWSLDPKLLTHFSTTIYNIYTATVRSVYYLKPRLEDLVYLLLVHFSGCKDHLKLIVFSQYRIDIEYDGETIKIEYAERENQLHLEHEIDWVLNLIDKRKDIKLWKSMFITLLDMYTHISSNEYSVMEKLFIVKGIQHLIENEVVQKSLSTESEVVLNLVKSILKENSEEDVVDHQIVSIALMVLGCTLENISGRYKSELGCFVNYLQKIADAVEDGMFKMMVLEVQEKIEWVQNNGLKKPVGNPRTIVDVLKNAKDPLLPCRSHALIELKKMIDSGDETVLAKKSEILIVIQENLKNPDSYLYMSAIFTLSSFCSFFPGDILPILCEQYSMPKNYNHSPETRLKIGEVLMKTIKLLNEIAPSHKNRLLNTFMAGVRDDDYLVRASSLSNLAEVCRLLRYSLGPIVSEIVNCADCVLRYDPAIEPRRAAALLLRMIIEGGDSEILDILADSIQDIYRMLKFHYKSDADQTIQLHAQIAIEKLNDSMKSLFLNELKPLDKPCLK